MVVNRKVSGKALSIPAGIGIGAGIGLLVTLIGTGILAWLLGEERIAVQGTGYGVMVILVLSSLLGPWIAAALVKHQRLVVCLATGGVYLLVLTGMNILWFGGQFQGILPTVLLILGGSTGAALVGNGRQGNRTSARHKRRYG